MALRQRRNACRSRASAAWLAGFDPVMTKVRSGPNCASIGLAQDALVGVRHNSTWFRFAHRRMAGVLFADFRYGNSAHAFDKIRNYALMRLALFLAKRHQRGRAWGFAQIYRSPDQLGLISLNGIVVAPRPNRAWRAPAEHRR